MKKGILLRALLTNGTWNGRKDPRPNLKKKRGLDSSKSCLQHAEHSATLFHKTCLNLLFSWQETVENYLHRPETPFLKKQLQSDKK